MSDVKVRLKAQEVRDLKRMVARMKSNGAVKAVIDLAKLEALLDAVDYREIDHT